MCELNLNPDVDRLSRDKIKNDIHHNFFVEAGAGSGKTTVLVDRMVSMVEGGIDIAKICAITFTKAAAGEFYSRFRTKLAKSNSEKAKKALKNIDLCFMGTIDSFCNKIIAEHPSEAGVPSNVSVISEEEEMLLYAREYSAILNGGVYSEELTRKARRFDLLFDRSEKVFIALMGMLAKAKDAHLNYQPVLGEPNDFFQNDRENLLSLLRALNSHRNEVSVKGQKPLEAWKITIASISVLSDSWDKHLDKIQKALGGMKGLRLNTECSEMKEALGPLFDYYFLPHLTRNKLAWYELSEERLKNLGNKIASYLHSIALDFASASLKAIASRLKVEGKLTYSDYLMYLRDLLREDAGKEGRLIDHIYQRHSYFLIDEFQDTNPIQAEIFFLLTSSIHHQEWKDCTPIPGSLFIVGDPKQSIYRFNQADVSSFLRVKKLFENPRVGEVLYLTRNFRSSDEMCHWFDDVFSKLLPSDTEIQSQFQKIPLGEKQPYAATLNGAYHYCFPNTKSPKDSAEPECVARMIKGIVNNPSITIQDRDVNGVACTPRRPSYGDFMVITPRKKYMNVYIKALADKSIPFKAEGIVDIPSCESLLELSYLFEAIAKPLDKKARYALENLTGFQLDEKKLLDYAEKAKRMTPASLFAMLMDEEHLFSVAGSDKAEILYQTLELLRNAEVGGEVNSLSEASAFLSSLISKEKKLERCSPLEENNDTVLVANLHKVKGLERAIVILVDPHGRAPKADKRIDYASNPPESYIFSVTAGENFSTLLQTPDYAAERESELAVLAAENTRLQYVAATRASNALIVASPEGSGTEKSPWYPFLVDIKRDIFDLLDKNEDATTLEKETADAESLYSSPVTTVSEKKKEATYIVRKPSSMKLKSKVSPDDGEEPEKKVPSGKKNAALIGSIVHRAMEVLVSSADNVDKASLIEDILSDFDADSEEYRLILSSVIDKVRSGGFPQLTSVPEDILKELIEADEVYCELPFCYKKAHEIWHGVIDAVYQKGGEWHIIDYKTNAEAEGLDEHYQEQLDAYIDAFYLLTGKKADARIYHIDV